MDATDNNSALGFYQMKLFMSICGSIQNILIRDLFGMLFFVSLHQLVKDLAFFQPPCPMAARTESQSRKPYLRITASRY